MWARALRRPADADGMRACMRPMGASQPRGVEPMKDEVYTIIRYAGRDSLATRPLVAISFLTIANRPTCLREQRLGATGNTAGLRRPAGTMDGRTADGRTSPAFAQLARAWRACMVWYGTCCLCQTKRRLRQRCVHGATPGVFKTLRQRAGDACG